MSKKKTEKGVENKEALNLGGVGRCNAVLGTQKFECSPSVSKKEKRWFVCSKTGKVFDELDNHVGYIDFGKIEPS